MTQWGLDTLFNPAKRHMDEEKRRLQSTRAEIGDNSGGKRIDLESGKVRIRRAEGDADADADSDPPAAERTEAVTDAGPTPREAPGGTASSGRPPRDAASRTTSTTSATPPSAAAVRAAQRRGRSPR